VTVLANSAALQAVHHSTARVAGAAFMVAGTVEVRPGLSVSVDQPCVVVIRYSADEFSAAVANPRNQAMTVHMTVTRDLTGPNAVRNRSAGTTQLTYSLPGGDYAGQSVVQTYAITPGLSRASNLWLTLGNDM
jgi:chondroitin AC lyase